MTTSDNKFYLPYLNKLVDQYNNTYHHSINKKPTNAEYSFLFQLKRLRQILNIFILVKFARKIGPCKYLLSILC